MRKKQQVFQLLIAIFVLSFLSSCASDPKKPSPVSTDVGRIQGVFEEMADAYQQRDSLRIFEKLDPSSELLDSTRKGILQDFNRFSEADLSFMIERIEIEEKSLIVVVRWRGSWKMASAPRPIEKGGDALFFLAGRKDPKLTEIRGSSPFGTLQGTE